MSEFTYDPNEANPVLDPGRYDAVVMAAEVKDTKKGDPMLVVQVKVYDPDGIKPTVFDNITRPYGIRRLKQLCEVTGVSFDNGSIDPQDLVGQNVVVELRIKKDPNGMYEDANAVVRYEADGRSQSHQATEAAPEQAEDAKENEASIPF